MRKTLVEVEWRDGSTSTETPQVNLKGRGRIVGKYGIKELGNFCRVCREKECIGSSWAQAAILLDEGLRHQDKDVRKAFEKLVNSFA